MSRPDPVLVEQLHQDNIRAFDTLYKKYHIAVYRNILKFTKDTVAAEDILQEVFTRLWEKRQQLDPEQSVVGWLFVISFNLSVNYSRKKLREQVMHKTFLISHTQEVGLEGVPIINEEQYLLLEEAINQLSSQKRKVVNLCKLENKTYKETAAELNISPHTVKEHLSAAMTFLNDYVRKNGNHSYLAVFLLLLNSLK